MRDPATAPTEPDFDPHVLAQLVRARARLLALCPATVLAVIIGCIGLAVAAAVLAISDPTGPGGRGAVVCGVLAGLFGCVALGLFKVTDTQFEHIVRHLDQLHQDRSVELPR